MADEWVSQREFDQLRADMHRMDDHGTRGISGVLAQLAEVIRDVAELKAETNSRFSEHQRQHDREADERASARRFTVTTTVAILVLLVAMLALIVTHPMAGT